MRPLRLFFPFAALGCALLLAIVPASAQQQPAAPRPAQPPAPAGAAVATPATSVGVVDIQRLFRESAAGKSANQQLADLRARYQTEIAKIEERLRVEEAELNRARVSLPPDQFETKRRDLTRKVQETQRQVQERNTALDSAQAQARDEMLKVIQQIVIALMGERGFTLILDQAQVLLSHDGLNITQEALRRLDQQLPRVRVAAPNLPPAR